MKNIFISLLILFCIHFSFALDTLSTKYYPLKVGNSWTWIYFHYGFPSETHKGKSTITGTMAANGHLYYIFNSGIFNIRIDSTFGRLLQYSTNGCPWLNNEILLDSLSSRLNDSSKVQCGTENSKTLCIDTTSKFIFGLQKPSKTFNFTFFEHGELFRYIKDIGYSYHFLQMGGPYYFWDTLQGCVINGVVYGDTSLTGINPLLSEIPKVFSLSQNYPNPFNPASKIKFQIAKLGDVQLFVYDILGREAATLVNEKLQPGTYEVEWDATNYPSGVYFYTLKTELFNETKRMVLLK